MNAAIDVSDASDGVSSARNLLNRNGGTIRVGRHLGFLVEGFAGDDARDRPSSGRQSRSRSAFRTFDALRHGAEVRNRCQWPWKPSYWRVIRKNAPRPNARSKE